MFDRDHVRNMIRRGTISAIDDSSGEQMADFRALAGETFSKVYRPQPFGFTSTPPQGATGLVVNLGGRSDRAVFLGGEIPDKRPKGLGDGATAIYGPNGEIVSLVKDAGTFAHPSKIRIKVGDMLIVVSPNRIDLGADPAPYQVSTTGGPSTKVFAVV